MGVDAYIKFIKESEEQKMSIIKERIIGAVILMTEQQAYYVWELLQDAFSEPTISNTVDEKGMRLMCEIMKNLINESRMEGEAIGMKKGEMKTLLGLVKDGFLTMDVAAKRANMTVENFNLAVAKYEI